MKDANENGVQTSIHYPLPIHRQLAYKNHHQHNIKFNKADAFGKNLVSLPIFPEMKDSEINKVIDTVITISKQK